jgi:hypothetical protein
MDVDPPAFLFPLLLSVFHKGCFFGIFHFPFRNIRHEQGAEKEKKEDWA